MGECEGRSKGPNDPLPFDSSSPGKAEEHDSVSSNSVCRHFPAGVQVSPEDAEKVEDYGELWPQLTDLMSLPDCEVLKSESSASPTELDHSHSELEQKLKGLLYIYSLIHLSEMSCCL